MSDDQELQEVLETLAIQLSAIRTCLSERDIVSLQELSDMEKLLTAKYEALKREMQNGEK